MSILQFLAEVIGSISWPLTVITVVVILRKPLSTIILSLSKVSYKDVNLECSSLWQILKAQEKQLDKKDNSLITTGNSSDNSSKHP